MQLRRPERARALGAALVLLALGREAAADGEVTVRGAYYKERSTRVAQPMIDGRFEVGENGQLDVHALLDSISSASIAAGAAGTAFDESRYELGGSYLHRIGTVRFGGGGRLSSEPDYRSGFLHLRGDVELADRNTTIAVYLAGGRDEVSNEGAQGEMGGEPIEGTLHTSLGSVSLSQVLSPVLVGQLTYDLIHLDGFQENPYRLVIAGGELEKERVPETRTRHAAQAALRGFVARTGSTLVGSYRFYADDWGLVGHTPEVRAIQEVVAGLDVHLRYRYHRQGRADFYQTVYDSSDPAVEPYLTDDVKLNKLTTHTIGGKVDLGLSLVGFTRGMLAGARLHTAFDYIAQSTYYGNAVSAQLAVSVPFEY